MLPDVIVSCIKALIAAGLVDKNDARAAWAEGRFHPVDSYVKKTNRFIPTYGKRG